MKKRTRYSLFTLVGCLGIALATWLPYQVMDPISIIHRLADAPASERRYQTWGGALVRTRDGYVVVLKTTYSSLDCEYVVISKLSDQIQVELLRGPGLRNVEVLTGKDAINFLDTANLNVEAFD